MGAPSLEAVFKAHATRKLARRIKWRGLDISIENDKGDTRKGVGPDGKAWATTMTYPYGYVKGTQSLRDLDHQDVVVNEQCAEECDTVYVVHTLRPDGGYDEDKSYIGFSDESLALAAFSGMYDQPERHFGSVTAMSADDFVAYCKGGRENWDRPLVPRAKMKVQLARLAHGRLEKAQQERRDWMRGVIETAKAETARHGIAPLENADGEIDYDEPLSMAQIGLGHLQKDDSVATDAALLIAKAVELLGEDASEEVSKAAGVFSQVMSRAQMEIVENSEGRRLLRIVPGYDAMDIQGEFISTEVIKKYWPYYETAGNIDIEHLTKKGGDNFEETRAALYAQGFPAENKWGRIEWEIGRPVADSFDEETCSFIAEIRQGPDDVNGAANWFWRTVTEITPPWVWKPSVAGRASHHRVVAEIEDPMLGIENRKQQVNVIDVFLWDNVGLTIEPVNHWVAPVEIAARQQVQKGLTMTDSSTPTLIQGTLLPAPEGKVASKEVVKAMMLASAQSAIADMLEAGELEASDAGELLGELSKALAVFGDGYLSPYVSKALDFGQLSTNTADLAGGYAATREGLSPFKKKKMARELYEDTRKGLTPFQKGFQFSDAPPVDVADFLVEEYDLGGEDALDVAETFLENLSAWAAGL